MSSSRTTRNGFDKQAYGDNPDTWGIDNLNTDLDLIDEALDGICLIQTADTTGGTYTLSATDYATNQARRRVIWVTSALTSALTIVIPNEQKNYQVKNATSGAYSLTVKTSGGTGITVTQGSTWKVFCDGIGSGTCSVETMPINNLPAQSADYNANSYKITGLTAGSSASDAVRYDQLPGPAWLQNGGTKTADFNVTAGYEYIVDTTGGNVTATMPASAAARDRVSFIKIGTGTLTVGFNGLKFDGSTATISSKAEGISELRYSGVASRGWTDL